MEKTTLLNMILEAYRDEREADFFYTRLLGETEDFEAVDVLAEARRDERVHAGRVRGIILAMTGSLPKEPDVQIPQYHGFEEAIRIAMMDEREATELYARIINTADSPEVKNAFYYIREDEIVHALKFEALLNELKDEPVGNPVTGPLGNFTPEL